MKNICRVTKLRKLIALSIVIIFACYVLACCAVSFYPLLKMMETNTTANNVQLGEARKAELEGREDFKNDLPNGVNLFFFPCENPVSDKFVVVCPGGGYVGLSMEAEGYSIAARLNELGYTAFVLEYRTGKNSTYHAPLDDLGCAITFVLANKERFNIGEGYALCGFSAGGNLIGLFGSTEFGYKNYNLPSPELLIMGYPWLTQVENGGFNIYQTVYLSILNGRGRKAFLGEGYTQTDMDTMNVPLWVDECYPPCYIMHGESDTIVPADTSSGAMVAILKEKSIPYEYKRCPSVNHGVGLGDGTSADGWLAEAITFWSSL